MGLVRLLKISKTGLGIYLDSVQYMTQVLTLWCDCCVNNSMYGLQKVNEMFIGLTCALCGLGQVVEYLKNWTCGLAR